MSDVFVVAQGEGAKVIQNFTDSATLRLIGGPLTSFAAVKSAMTQRGTDVILDNGGTMIAFRNATIGQFNADDFQLPLASSVLGAITFNEEFDSPGTIAANWKTNYGYAGTGLNSYTLPANGELQIYADSTFKGTSGAPLGLNPFSFNSGILTITAQPVSDAISSQMWGYRYVSGMLQSNYTQTYGYFEIRVELPHGKGLWPAFWMLGETNREIDILEVLGSDTKTANNALHSNAVPAIGNPSFNPYGDGFHTYGALWTPTTVTFYVDRTAVWQTPTPSDMNQPLKMIVNLGIGGSWAGAPDSTTPWPAGLKVDYIRAYALNDGSPAPTPPPTPTPVPTPTPPPGPSGDAGMVLTSSFPGATLAGGAGTDTLNASQGSDRLTGGAGADQFVFRAMPWSAGRITDFQPGTDKLNVSALTGYGGSDLVGAGYVTFASDGAGGTRVLLDIDGPGGANGLKFHVVTLDGVSPGALSSASFTGGSAAPAPTPAPGPGPAPTPAPAGVVLTSSYPGATLAGGAGTDTLNASQGADRLTGGGGADQFVFRAMPWSAGRITDFQVGTDKLNVSGLTNYGGSDLVGAGYVTFASDGTGGTRVLLDVDGPGGASSLKFHVVTLEGVAPGALSSASFTAGAASPAPSPAPSPTPAGVVLTSSYPGATLTGGAGSDTLNASQGADRLIGGAGDDDFVFGALPWSAGRIADFTPNSDVLDLRALFRTAGYSGSDPVADGYLSIVSDGMGGSRVLFDADGRGSGIPWPITIATLENVAPANLDASDWLFR